MENLEQDHAALGQLVGCWEGTLRHRGAAHQPFQELPGKSENRWVLGGKFVEMTVRGGLSGDAWSALFYIGYERSERRYVLVSREPGDPRVTIRRGAWAPDPGRLVLVSRQQDPPSRIVCDFGVPGALRLELAEETAPGEGFVRFTADYRSAASLVAAPAPPLPRPPRRFVIA